MVEPIIAHSTQDRTDEHASIAAIGQSFTIHEWSGSGPDYLHLHHADDEAWHILEGTLTFRFVDRQVEAVAGTTVFVPAGVPHTYYEANGPTRYLLITTPRIHDLISALHTAPYEQHPAIMRRFKSEVVSNEP